MLTKNPDEIYLKISVMHARMANSLNFKNFFEFS